MVGLVGGLNVSTYNERGLIMYLKYWDLNPAIQRKIGRLEKELDRKCTSIWLFKNPLGELHMFARFCRQWDRLIVTLAAMRYGVMTTHEG